MNETTVILVVLIILAAVVLVLGVTGKPIEGKVTRDVTVPWIKGDGDYIIEVVGERYRQDALEAICGGHNEDGHDHDCQAVLLLDNENEHDNKAVEVQIDGRHVGFLSREDARWYRRTLKAAGWGETTIAFNAKIRGGWERPGRDIGLFGVVVDIPEPLPKREETASY